MLKDVVFLKLCTNDYIRTMCPAGGVFLLLKNLWTNPVILKCLLWEWSGKRRYPASKIRGGGKECQAATVQELPRGANPRPKLGVAAGRSNPRSKVAAQLQEGQEAILRVQGQEGRQ